MLLIVEYKACALWERLVAGFAVFVDEPTFEVRLSKVRTFDRDLNLLVSIFGQHFEPSVVRSACDGQFFRRDRYHRLNALLAYQSRLKSR